MDSGLRIFTVRPDGAGELWLLEEAGDERPQAFSSRDEAIDAGKKLAQAHGPARLRVQRHDGGVDFESEYEQDPLVTQLEKFGF